MVQAINRHSGAQQNWFKQIEKISAMRNAFDVHAPYHKKKMNRTLRDNSLGSLLERQQVFAYDPQGSKKPGFFWAHKQPKRDEDNPPDLQKRMNGFYQSMRDSDVTYTTT